VEFALTLPIFLLLVLGIVDFSRLVQANTSVAEAARLGARQAASDADAGDAPWDAFTGRCSGGAQPSLASGTGCLTDAAVKATIDSVMVAGGLSRSSTVYTADPVTCRDSSHAPAQGGVTICILPAESGTPVASGTPCSSNPGAGTLGTRHEEWSAYQAAATNHRGCYLVEVTIVYAWMPLNAVVQSAVGPRLLLSSTSSTTAEY
jgi:hypothetical protein